MHLASVAKEYIERFRSQAFNEMRHYVGQESLALAIREAALSSPPNQDGKRVRHSHQRRIPRSVLHTAERRLQAQRRSIAKSKSFAELHDAVRKTIATIHGIGDLATYDIAHRIGAYLKLQPEKVYLHAGTRDGAKALGLVGDVLERRMFPRELRKLSAAELEDCLCIYKDKLRGQAKWSKQTRNHCAKPASASGCYSKSKSRRSISAC